MKKVLSVVLALALVLGSFSMVFASSTGSAVVNGVNNVRLTDIAGNDHQEAIQVAYDLGIVQGNPDGTFAPDNAVTRAEFAAMIVRALAIPNSALAGYSTSRFNDTSGYGWAVPYLAYCQERGIMLGDGYGNAMPGRTITANEAVTMVLRAIGYTNNAATLVGTWPANYVTLGQSLGLYQNVAADAQINRANAAQMIYNGLTVPLVQVGTNGQVTTITQLVDGRQQAVNMLTAGLDCYEWPERKATNNGAWQLQYTVFTKENTDNSKINMTPYIGAYGMVYKSNKDDEIVAIGEIKTKFVTGEFTFSNSNFDKFEIDDVEYTLGSNAKAVLKAIADQDDPNGESIGNFDTLTSGSYFEAFLNGATRNINNTTSIRTAMGLPGYSDDDSSRITMSVDLSGRTINMIHAIALWDVEEAGSDHFLYESGMLTAKEFDGHDFPLTDTDAIDYNAFELIGVNSLDEIKTDNVVYIYEDPDDDEISRVAVGTETVSGKVTRVTTDGDYTIGGKVYNYAFPNEDGIDRAGAGDALSVNDEGIAYLDAYGDIYYFDKSAGSRGHYAVFLDKSDGTFNTPQVKLYMPDGEERVYDINSTYEWNGSTATPNGNTGANLPGNNTLVKYTLTSNKVKTLANNLDGGATLDTGRSDGGRFNAAGTVFTPINSGVKSSGLSIDSNVVVYTANSAYDEFTVSNMRDVRKDTDINGRGNDFQWMTDRNGRIVAMIVPSPGSGAESVYAVINKVAVVGSGDSEVNELEGIDISRSSKTWTYDNDDYLSDVGDNGIPTPFLVEFSVTENGVLRNAEEVAVDTANSNVTIEDYRSGSVRVAGSGWVGIASNTVVFVQNSAGDAWEARTPSKSLLANNSRTWNLIQTDEDEPIDVIMEANVAW